MIHKEQAKIIERGSFQYIRTIHPDIAFKESVLTFRKSPGFSINIKDIWSVSINLSVFIGDVLAVNIIDNQLYLTKNLGFQQAITALPIPVELVNVMKACGDEIRLKILKIFWNGQATTQSLAETLHLSPSAISLHLKQLKAASLVDCYKEGKFVRYYANPSAVNRIHNRLIDYFEK